MRFFHRDEEIIRLCHGKTVLHLGCIGWVDAPTQEIRLQYARNSLHSALSEVADVTGLDYSPEAIDYFRDHGVFDNVIHGNAEKLDEVGLDQTFDVIVAGDIIEHLSNPGLMLDGLKRFMRPDTVVIITTPNAFGLNSFGKYTLGKFREGTEHVASYNPQNLANLLERHGYEVRSMDTCYQSHAAEHGGLGFKIGKQILGTKPELGGTLFVQASYENSPSAINLDRRSLAST